MQVLCKVSTSEDADVRCTVCGQGFHVYWARTSRTEQARTRLTLEQELANQHASSASEDVHPRTGFTIPKWSGMPKFSGAALLGGAHSWSV